MVAQASSRLVKIGQLATLLRRLAPEEVEIANFLIRLLFGEFRRGALEGVLLEAVARAGSVSPGALRRAVMMAGELMPVARAVLVEGESGLARFAVQIYRRSSGGEPPGQTRLSET